MSEQTQPSIYGRMAAVLADVGAIEKTRKNQAQGFQFRGIDDAMNELHGTFAKHAIFLTHEVRHHTMTERETRNGGKSFHHLVEVQFTFWAPDGSSVSAVGIGEAADTGDKGAGKAMAYALKVCLLQTFLIPTEEEKDPDYRVTEWQGKALAAAKQAQQVSVKPAATQPVAPIELDETKGATLTPGPQYQDTQECKALLARELRFYGIHSKLANYADIAREIHGMCLNKPQYEVAAVVSAWANSKGFQKGDK